MASLIAPSRFGSGKVTTESARTVEMGIINVSKLPKTTAIMRQRARSEMCFLFMLPPHSRLKLVITVQRPTLEVPALMH